MYVCMYNAYKLWRDYLKKKHFFFLFKWLVAKAIYKIIIFQLLLYQKEVEFFLIEAAGWSFIIVHVCTYILVLRVLYDRRLMNEPQIK